MTTTHQRVVYRTAPASDPEAYDALNTINLHILADAADARNVFKVDPALPTATGARIVTVEIDGDLAGALATYLSGASGHVASLGVHRAYRGRGLATKLVRTAVDDRFAFDGASLPLVAGVRILRDGSLNVGSAKALQANGFECSHLRRYSVANAGPPGGPSGRVRRARRSCLCLGSDPNRTVTIVLPVASHHLSLAASVARATEADFSNLLSLAGTMRQRQQRHDPITPSPALRPTPSQNSSSPSSSI